MQKNNQIFTRKNFSWSCCLGRGALLGFEHSWIVECLVGWVPPWPDMPVYVGGRDKMGLVSQVQVVYSQSCPNPLAYLMALL